MNTCSLSVCGSVNAPALPKDNMPNVGADKNVDADKTTSKPTAYIDIKSEGLRDVLRTVLKQIKWISLGGDKPSVYAFTNN